MLPSSETMRPARSNKTMAFPKWIDTGPYEHIRLFFAVNEARSKGLRAKHFLRLMCRDQADYDSVLSKSHKRWKSWLRYCAINAIHGAYPRLSSVQIGEIIGREHSTVLKMMTRLKMMPMAIAAPHLIVEPKKNAVQSTIKGGRDERYRHERRRNLPNW